MYDKRKWGDIKVLLSRELCRTMSCRKRDENCSLCWSDEDVGGFGSLVTWDVSEMFYYEILIFRVALMCIKHNFY